MFIVALLAILMVHILITTSSRSMKMQFLIAGWMTTEYFYYLFIYMYFHFGLELSSRSIRCFFYSLDSVDVDFVFLH